MAKLDIGITPVVQGSKVTRYVDPRVRVVFFRHDGTSVDTELQSKYSNTGRASSDVISVTTMKSVGNPIGTWSVQLVPRAEYFNFLPEKDSAPNVSLLPGDWGLIESDNGDGVGWRPLMYGPITDTRRRRQVTDKGAVVETYQISGADFGKALARISAIADTTLGAATNSTDLGSQASIAKRLESTKGTPAKFLRSIMDRFYAAALEQVFDPRTGKPFKIVDQISDDVLGNALITPPNLAATLWQLLEQFSNPSINELFCDLRLAKDSFSRTKLVPALVLRQFPFFGNAWKNLDSVFVERSEIIADDLGRSDGDVRNWIRPMDEPQLRSNPKGISMFNEHVGVMNTESIKRFGFSRYEAPTPYCYNDDGTIIEDMIQKFTALQTLWHHSNERLISGSMELYHRPDIRIGYRLEYYDTENSEQLQFYVESVQHSLNYPGRSSTTVTVTRGRDVRDQRFLRSIGDLRRGNFVQELGTTLSRIQGAVNP